MKSELLHLLIQYGLENSTLTMLKLDRLRIQRCSALQAVCLSSYSMALKAYSILSELLVFRPFWKAEEAVVQSLQQQQLHCDKYSHQQEPNIGKPVTLTLPRLSVCGCCQRLLLTLRGNLSPWLILLGNALLDQTIGLSLG